MEKLGVVIGVKRIALLLLLVSNAVFNPLSALAAKNVTLAWNASTDSSVTGYKVHYGPSSGGYTNSVTFGNTTTGTIPNLQEGVTYYFAATSSDGNTESDFSNEIAYTVPLTPGVNLPPTLNTIANVTVNEDSSAQSVSLTGIGTGGESQMLTITASSSNTGLIPNPTVSYTSPNAAGSLAFTPVANASGTATITVTVNDGQAANNTIVRTFTVTVNAVNDAPTLNALSDFTMNEDASGQTVNLAGIGTGAANETQTLLVTAISANPSVVPNPTVVYTSPNSTGTLTVRPAAGASGTALISVTVNDGQAANNTIGRTFIVTVNAVNNAPTLNALSNVTMNEDDSGQTVSLSGIGTGAANETQTLVVTATSSNPNVVPNPTVAYSSPNSTGSLTITPAAGASGTATITVTVNDGQSANNTVVRTFTVTVNAVNDTPTLNTLNNVTINEDAGAQTVNLSGISSGSANESQTLSVTATSSNPSLVPNPGVNYTSGNTTGSLGFTPVANANGTATITITVNDGQAQNNTVVRTFTVTVNSVNDAPTLSTLGNLTLAENAAQQTVSLAGIGSGAANESQTLTVTATSSNPSLIPNPAVNYSSPGATGSLTFTPAADANGTATITVTVNDGDSQNNTVVRTFTVTVNGVNNPPTLNTFNNVTINEDAGAQSVSLAGIGTGAANETQTLTVTATSSNPSLIPNPAVTYTSPNAAGSLSFTPTEDANGTATITVTVNDGQAQNNTVVRTFLVTVNAVNDSPEINQIGNLSIADNAGAQMVSLSGINSGAANESQTLAVTATSSNPSLIPNPTVNYASPAASGSLSFTPVLGGSGTATITVTVNDGQAQNNTVVRTFTVSVNAVNIAPTLSTIANVNVSEDAAAQTVNLAGIGSGASYESQTLTVTATSSNPSLIPNPTVSYTSPNTTGSLSLIPAANATGTSTITVTVNDGQAQNNTIVRTFTVTVNAVNDAPTLNTLSNLSLNEDAGAQSVNLSGISSGASNEVQTLTVTATSSAPNLIPNPTVSYASPNTTGTLTFTPATSANGTATITVTVNDGQAQNNTVVRTFTVTVNGVNNPPTLNNVANVTLNEDAGAQTVSLSGIGSGAANESQTLTVTATSGNPSLIPNPTVTYSSPNATGSLNFTPVANAYGSAIVTVTINDGQSENNTVVRTFTVTVNPINDAPTLNTIAGLDFGGLSPNAMLPKTVTLTGIGTGASNENQVITVTATSSNPSLVPHPTVNYTSPNSSGTLTVAPTGSSSGTATITVTANDGQAQNNIVTRTFAVTVNAQNGTPTITAIGNQVTVSGTATPAIPFAIGDAETPADSLTLVASSSNPVLVTTTNIVFGGSGSNRTVTVTPERDQSGSSDITITVSDGIKFATATFRLDVSLPTQTASMTLVTNGSGTITAQALTAPNQLSGATYQLTAKGAPGQMFSGWTGSTNSSSPSIRVTLRSNEVFQANFAPFRLTVNGKGSVTPDLRTQSGLVAGTVYTVTASPAGGQVFAGWSGSSSSSSTKLQFTMAPSVNLQANFTADLLPQIAGTYTGLIYENEEVRQNSSGYLVALVNNRGGYSGWVQMGGNRLSYSGQMGANCTSTNTLPGGLTLELSFGTGSQLNHVTGRLVGNGFQSTAIGDRAIYYKQNPTTNAGDYTMALAGQRGSATTPAGDGVAFIRVQPDGVAHISVTLGDGTPFTHSTYVSPDGNLPLYSPLYTGGNGSVLGWLSLSNRPTDDISGTVNWIKPAIAGGPLYKNGFTNQCEAFGSRYIAPGKGQNYLALTSGQLAFSGGNLSADFANSIQLSGYGMNNLSTNAMRVGFQAPYGLIQGWVYAPGASTYNYFQGVFLQKQNGARGSLTGTDQTSQMVLGPSVNLGSTPF